ncbi:hypothetical protein M9Y10_001998 [Tritrichomonas musculus]|uniref:Uncharacterized protein n=1 Tax=Tritrichomonas musculus TaxID=1915356 RepID=A0ABR2L9M5_9EUKA
MSEDTLVYYPNPPIPLDKDFTDIVINELNFIEPFAPPLFESLSQEEADEFQDILANISGIPVIPSCERPHKAPEFKTPYLQKRHYDGYPIKIEALEDDGPGFQADGLTGEIGNVKRDKAKRLMYIGGTISDSDDDGHSVDTNLQKRAETEALKRADEMAEREARNRAEEALRKSEEAKKKAEEAAKLAEEARKKQMLEEARKFEEERRKREEEEERRLEEKRKLEEKRRLEEKAKKEEEERKRREAAAKKEAPKPVQQKELPPVLRNRFQNLKILNPGGAPTSIHHMKRIIQSNKSNEAVVNRPSAS